MITIVTRAAKSGKSDQHRVVQTFLYAQARQRNPARWSGSTRDWSHIGAVTLNPERDAVVNMAASAQHTQHKAA